MKLLYYDEDVSLCELSRDPGGTTEVEMTIRHVEPADPEVPDGDVAIYTNTGFYFILTRFEVMALANLKRDTSCGNSKRIVKWW